MGKIVVFDLLIHIILTLVRYHLDLERTVPWATVVLILLSTK